MFDPVFDPAINTFLQRFSHPWLDNFLVAVTASGTSVGVAILLAVLYWTWDRRQAFVLIQFILYSGLLNHMLKELFQTPRPFQVAPGSVQVLDLLMRAELRTSGVDWAIPARTSYGFPSGHAQVAVCLWGALAFHFRRRDVIVLAVFMVCAITYSRLHLGVHFLGDVLGGLAVGGVSLALYARWSGVRVSADRFPTRRFLCWASYLVPILVLCLLPDPRTARRVGLLLGVTVGYWSELRLGLIPVGGKPFRTTLASALGVVLLCGLVLFVTQVRQWLGADYLAGDPMIHAASAYFVIGLFVGTAHAWLFHWFGLTRVEKTGSATAGAGAPDEIATPPHAGAQ